MRACGRMFAPGTGGPRAEPPFGLRRLEKPHLSKVKTENKKPCFIREPFGLLGTELSSSEETDGWEEVQRSYSVLRLVEKLRSVIPAL